jgi:RNA polymerase sigma-70 factor (ECF subfamily)
LLSSTVPLPRRVPDESEPRVIAESHPPEIIRAVPLQRNTLVNALLEHASDADLHASIRCSDSEALAEVYRRHAGAVFGLARRVTGNTQLGEEVLQEIFVRLWDQPSRFDPARGELRSFLVMEAHSRAVERLRSEAARWAREERAARLRAEAGYDLDLEIADMVVAEEVRAALEVLTEAERRAIELAYFNGMTYREVATFLGEPEGTIKSRIRSGLMRLRERLSDLEAGESWVGP